MSPWLKFGVFAGLLSLLWGGQRERVREAKSQRLCAGPL